MKLLFVPLLAIAFLFTGLAHSQDILATVAPNVGGSDNFVDLPNTTGGLLYFFTNPSPSAARMAKVTGGTGVAEWPSIGNFAPDPNNSFNRIFGTQTLRVYPKTLPAGTTILIEFSYSPVGTRYYYRVLVTDGVQVTSINTLDPSPTAAVSVRWRVNFDSPVSNVTANNFAFSQGSGNNTVSGVSITSVVPDTPQPSSSWTVTANTGSYLGLLYLNWAGSRTESPVVPNTFTGFPYTFQVAPFFDQNLGPVGINRTSTVTLNVNATLRNGDPVYYQWYTGSAFDTNPVAIPGATGASYTPPAFNTVGTYLYHCVAYPNPLNPAINFQKSATATITVVDPPQITSQPSSQSIFIGQTATLTTSASGTSPQYQWYRGTAPDTSQPVGGNSPSFTTPALNNSASYWVRVSNAGPTVVNSNTATITVTEQPSLTVSIPGDVSNNLDSQTSLREAIAYAHSLGGARTVDFAPSLAGQTVTLSDGWAGGSDTSTLQITGNITVQGLNTSPGVTLRVGTGVPRRHFSVQSSGSLTLDRLTLSNGYSTDYGGAVWNFGNLIVRNCTFVGNFAESEGGAIQAWGDSPSVLLENSTFTGNTSNSSGAALNLGSVSMTLRHLTITGNAGAAVPVSFWTHQATATNCLIAGNSVEGVASANGGTFHASSAGNILGTGTTAGLTHGVNGNTTGINTGTLRLTSLADNGGPTQTIAPLNGSPIINAGSSSTLTTDQRGQARVGAPDVGAFEDSSGFGDADFDTLSNLTEAILGTDPFLRDSDGDGFNDPTEVLNSTNPTVSSSKPGTTHFARVLGTGSTDGLDLSGNFPYAINIGTNGATGTIGNAQFTTDSASGITITAPNQISNWASRNFGNSAAENVLEGVVQSIRWGFPSQPVQVELANTVPGRRYKMQVIIAEGGDYNRRFDVLIDGSLVADDINPSTLQGIPISTYSAGAVVHEFTANGSSVTLTLDGSNVTTPSVDNNPILNAVTLEEIPTPALAPVVPPSGTHTGSLMVTLETPSQGAAIRYTTDGSQPTTTHGTLYTAPFTLHTTTTVRAIAFGGGWLPSEESSATYTLQNGLENWRSLEGLAADGSQDLAEPYNDGIPNLLKYAFNMNLTAGNTLAPGGNSGLPLITVNSTPQLSITFIRRKASTNPGVSYHVDATGNLENWSPLDLSTATLQSIDSQWERVTVTDPTSGEKRFARVRIETLSALSNNFATGRGNATLRGGATWSNGEIVLTEAIGGQGGSIVLDDLTTTPALNGFTARFDLNIGPPGQVSPADGVSFSVGNLGTSAWGENGPATNPNLTVGFDTYNNGPASQNIGIHLWVNGTNIAINPTNPFTNGATVPVEISHDLTNGITVKFNHAIIFSQVPTPGFSYPENGRFGFGARTGGAVQRTVIDNVVITPR
ncbi:MAG: chitobiase/beta-hexosaminidase C-terminal domain-containing protein [Akkermansiaceae bacterium]|jgi:hypothetical protein|nr:chitobiase/beta-hexosaminidase C-terminal domain-containing protein [Akkermansiaceae bacterium]